MADLTTVANVKQWLGVKATDDDTLLSDLVSGVSAWIQKWLDRTIATGDYTETVNGNGKDVLFLLNWPVTAVASVTVDGVAILARAGAGKSGYFFDKDCVYLDGYCFRAGRQNVVIQYTAGYAAVPADVELATKKLIGNSYREKERIGVSSKGLAGEQTNFVLKDLPADVEHMLQPYRRVVGT